MPTATMAARLTRARKKLADAAFTLPDGPELASRIGTVGEIAYLAFTTGYAPGTGADVLRPGPAGEAIRLVRVLRSVLPPEVDRAELDALLALMVLLHARRDARVVDGALVLLADQDRGRWHHGEALGALELLRPLVGEPPAPYLLQALIAAEHAIAPTPAATHWGRIVERYDELLALRESPVVRLNRAVALAERDGPAAGLAALGAVALPGHRLPAVRAELLARLGRTEEARRAYDAALALCSNDAESAYLRTRRREL
ncbi:RNA polymerase sigma factor [Pimelobacter simplex]|uniref:RNA polymerase sigma factor n=1 Tax=Nocardioides simplex TaxID=2045 RepID=UPI001EE3A7C5